MMNSTNILSQCFETFVIEIDAQTSYRGRGKDGHNIQNGHSNFYVPPPTHNFHLPLSAKSVLWDYMYTYIYCRSSLPCRSI